MTLSEECYHLPKHVAIIMDGNNRFAKKKQMQKGDGHREGKNVLDPIVEHCRKRNIQALTVFAFSSENWNRPQFEVDLLMQLLKDSIEEQIPRMNRFKIRLCFIGDRSKLSTQLQTLMADAEHQTAHFTEMTLNIAISYGGMWDISHAAKQLARDVQANKIDVEHIDSDVFARYMSMADLPAVDLLIRTGGDFRLSNFLLWQAAYAELYFTQSLWPEFTVDELEDAFAVFAGRERRFGKTSEQIQSEKNEND